MDSRSVVDLVGDIRVLQEGVHAQHRVVRLDARRGDLRARPHRERDLRLLAVVDGEALEEQAAETRPSATAARLQKRGSTRWHTQQKMQRTLPPFEGRPATYSGAESF